MLRNKKGLKFSTLFLQIYFLSFFSLVSSFGSFFSVVFFAVVFFAAVFLVVVFFAVDLAVVWAAEVFLVGVDFFSAFALVSFFTAGLSSVLGVVASFFFALFFCISAMVLKCFRGLRLPKLPLK